MIARKKQLASTFRYEGRRGTPATNLLFFVIDEIEKNFCDEIADWMEDDYDKFPWILYIPGLPAEFTGRLYIHNERRFTNCDGTIVVLKKNKNKFFMATIFPYNSCYEPSVQED